MRTAASIWHARLMRQEREIRRCRRIDGRPAGDKPLWDKGYLGRKKVEDARLDGRMAKERAKDVSRAPQRFRGSPSVFAFSARESGYDAGGSRIKSFEIFPVAPRPPNRGTPHHEAHLSTQRATPQAQARFSLPHADPLGACRHQATSPQGTPAAHCLGTDARLSRCDLRRDSPPSMTPARPGEPVESPSFEPPETLDLHRSGSSPVGRSEMPFSATGPSVGFAKP